VDQNAGTYPASLRIDYPERCDRLTTLFRIPLAIPICIVAGLAAGVSYNWLWMLWSGPVLGGGYVVLATILMILFRRKYPRWWFDWNLALTRFTARVSAYLLVLTHTYPSTDEDQAVHIDIAYPDAKTELGRGMPLIKWFLVLPHAVVLAFLCLAALFCTVVAWFAILLTGAYPRSLFDLVVGVMRWSLRVAAYAILMATDRYPPSEL
jgi:hypothetical protein